MDNPIQVDLGRIAQDLQIRRVQVESVVQLLDEGNTVPFITRYRKEVTGNLNEVIIREIQLRVQRLRDLAERKETILKTIEAQGKLTPDLTAAIRAADNPKRLEDLYLPFKPKKRTKASEARERGLEPLAFRIWTRDETLTDLTAAAQEFVSTEKGVDSAEKVLEGVGHILAEAISEMAAVRDAVRRVVWKTGKMVTAKADIPEGQGLEYRDYFDYAEPVVQIPPHRVLAINRGDKEGPLKVRLDVSRPDLESVLFGQLPLDGHPHGDLFRAAAIDALDRLILPSMEREVRRDLTEAAEKHAVEVFARNLRSLLLQPPIPKQVVLAVDPGFRTGCKIAVLDRGGNLLDQTVIYPHPPQNRRSEAKVALKDLVGKHQVGVVAIGNGTACRETEELVAEIIAEGTQFSQAMQATAVATEPQPVDSVSDHSQGGDNGSPQPPPAGPVPSQAESVVDEPVPVIPAHDHQANDSFNAHEAAEAIASASTADSGSEPQSSSPAQAPLESLPPIMGGAPESSTPEAEVEAAAGSQPPSDAGSTAVLDGPPPPADDLSTPSPTDHETVVQPDVTPNHQPEPAEQHGHPQPDAEPSPSPAPTAEPVEVATESKEQTEQAAVSPPDGTGEAAAAPAPTPARGPRPPGHGKSESSRSRPPRNKQAPPPPPSPPQPHPADSLLTQLAYVVVNEAGASVYSTSQVGREELPDLDATLRSGISIGRRLQDPLAELVKIEPQNIGVGLYQHDVNPKQLKETLESVIASCVNFVGVDLNTASVALLRHVSGLNQLTARRIVEYRKEHGPFTGREQLTQVEGVGPATFTQAAGFLKLLDGENSLDRTWIHPESYPVALKLLEKFEFTPDAVRDKVRLPELQAKLAEADLAELAKELAVGELTLRDIVEALARPERDPRDDLPKPIFKKGVLKIEDLSAGMELKGTVLNVVDFGAFVDIGLKDSGLVHISQLANRYVKSPHDVVSVGDVATVWVMGVDQERKRVSLTMVKPGTERHRGQQSGGRRPGGPAGEQQQRDRDPRGPGQGQRGGGGSGSGRSTPPRPIASALTSPPVGAPSVATLAEPAPRRPDRDRDRDRGGPPPGSSGTRNPEQRGPAPGGEGGPPGGAPPRHGQGHGHGSGPPPGRGGPRGPYPGPGPGGSRPPARQDQGPPNRPPTRPSRPSPPPPPLSKDALAGNVPLRSFGQLKQLWQARTDDPPTSATGTAERPPNQAAEDQPGPVTNHAQQSPESTETPPPAES
jgi:protein Tex